MRFGIRDVVALLGSWTTETQANLLAKIKTRYCLMLDNNLAGQSGTEELIYKLYKVSPLLLVEYPSKQPDDLNSIKEIAKKPIGLKTYKEIARKKEINVQSKQNQRSNQHNYRLSTKNS